MEKFKVGDHILFNKKSKCTVVEIKMITADISYYKVRYNYPMYRESRWMTNLLISLDFEEIRNDKINILLNEK